MGSSDPGGRDVGVPRVAVVRGGLLLQQRPGLRETRRRVLVRVDRRTVVRLGEDDVAERVVEVLVGVDHRHHLAHPEPADLLDHPPGLDLRAVGVHHEQAPLAADQPDVDVEELVARHPAPVGDLDEAGVVRDVQRTSGMGENATTGR